MRWCSLEDLLPTRYFKFLKCLHDLMAFLKGYYIVVFPISQRFKFEFVVKIFSVAGRLVPANAIWFAKKTR